jgi:hypothetical protein
MQEYCRAQNIYVVDEGEETVVNLQKFLLV